MPAIAVYQSMLPVTAPPLSQASQLPHRRGFANQIGKKRPGFSWSRASFMLLVESVALKGQCHALAAADAQGRQAFLGVALEHFMQQGHQHTAA